MFALHNESQLKFNERQRALKSIKLDGAKKLAGYPNIFILISKKNLNLIQAACCWIYTTKEGINFSLIQTKPKPLFYLNQSEVFEHEKVHALRCDLNSKKYEEILAFQTSKNPIRRFFSPLMSNNVEQITTLASCLFAPLSYYLSLSYPLYLLARLIIRQKKLQKCKKHLSKLSFKGQLILHLYDHEIEHFSMGHNFKRPWTLRAYQLHKAFKSSAFTNTYPP